MPRPQKEGIDYNPQYNSFEHAKAVGGKYLKRYLRNSSSGFIKKPMVRKYVLTKYNNRCCLCGDSYDLQVDHIVPVFYATVDNVYEINSLQNLRPLCRSCNSRRAVNVKTL